jgi:uncharacterized protein (TIGR02594 family)
VSFLEWLKSLFAGVSYQPAGSVKPNPPLDNVIPIKPGSPMPYLDWVRSHIGEHEIEGSQDNPFIMSLYKYANYPQEHDETPWCAVLVCAALELNGYKDSNSAAASSYAKYGESCELKQGAIVVIKHSTGSLAGHYHVTFCDGVIDKDYFWGLGGNQSNAITRAKYPRSDIYAVRAPVLKAPVAPVKPAQPVSPTDLSWGHPDWSAALLEAVGQCRDKLNKAADKAAFGDNGTLKFWAELVIAMAHYESAWNPASVYQEPPPPKGPGTLSVGLLQLSKGDARAYGVGFETTDEDLKDPIKNIKVGVAVLAHLIERDGCIQNSANKGGARYWSVLRDGHHPNDIKARIRAAL